MLDSYRVRLAGSFALLIAIAQAPALWALLRGGLPYGGDALSAFAPWREFTRQAIMRGILPLWNPHVFCGMPFLSNGQSALLYPPNLIYLFLPMPLALWIDGFAHQWWLALGGYALARALGLARSSSILVAALFSLGGEVSGHLYAGHMTWHAARAWVPWLLWAVLTFLRYGQARHAFIGALCAVMLLSAGHPPIAVFGALLTLGLIIAFATTHRLPRHAWQWALIGLILVVALSAAAVLPLKESSGLSLRRYGVTYPVAVIGSGSWRTFVRLLLPDFFGGNANPQWSMRYFPFEEAASIGLIPALLALGAPWLARLRANNLEDSRLPRAVLWLWWAMILGAILTLGGRTVFYGLAYDYVPMFRSLHVPVRWLELWYFCAVLLCGFSFDAWHQHIHLNLKPRFDQRILCGILFLLGISLTALALYIALTAPNSSLWLHTAQWNVERMPPQALFAAKKMRHAALQASLIGAAVSALGAFLFWSWGKLPVRSRFYGEALLVVLMIGELVGLFWRSALPLGSWYRKVSDWPPSLVAQQKPGQRWDSDFHKLWGDYAWSGGMPHGADLFNGYDPFSPHRFYAFASEMEGKDTYTYPYQPQRRGPLLRVASVSGTLSAPAKTVADKKPATSRAGDWVLLKRSGAWPRVYLTNNIQRVPEKRILPHLNRLAARDFYKQHQPVVVASGAFRGLKPSQANTAKGRIIRWQRDLNRWDIDLETSSSALLVVGDSHYPGWRAFVTSRQGTREAPIEWANFLFRGVALPAGARHVTLIYDPQTVRFAFFISLCGLSGSVAFFIFRLRRMAQ